MELCFTYDSSNEWMIYRQVLCGAYYDFIERAKESPNTAVEEYSAKRTDSVMKDMVEHIGNEKLNDEDMNYIRRKVYEHFVWMFDRIRLNEGIYKTRGKKVN